MNRNLSYRGKNIKEMTISELEFQYQINKSRFIYRSIFFILIAIAISTYKPLFMLLPTFVRLLPDIG